MLVRNSLKAKLREGRICISTGVSFYSPHLVEILAGCGADAISLDAEHGTLNEGQIEDLTRICDLAGLPVVCRVPYGRPEFILRIMDAGVSGIVVPHVNTREYADSVVSYVKYPPLGRRGLGNHTRATGYGRLKAAEYVELANSETMVTIQIEEPEGVQNIESIVRTPGLDCVFIGRNDLAAAMGFPGNAAAPAVLESVERVAAAVLAAGLTLQVVADEKEAPAWVRRGARLLSVGWASYVQSGLRQGIEKIRNCPAG
jgi:4-hydroxy-2-oxoheptanedioate aldolase